MGLQTVRLLARLVLLLGLTCTPAQAWWQSVAQGSISSGSVLSLDGSASANTSTGIVAPSLTTSTGSGVVVVAIVSNATSVISVTAAGLTFTARGADAGNGSATFNYSAPYTVNFSGVITVVMDDAQFTTVTVFGIGGAATTSYNDSNVSLPSVSGNQDNFSAFSTTNANDFIFINDAPSYGPPYTASAGWTLINGSDFQAVQYKIVSAVQSNVTPPDLASGIGVSNSIIDAIKKGP